MHTSVHRYQQLTKMHYFSTYSAVTWILIWATINNEGHEYWLHDTVIVRHVSKRLQFKQLINVSAMRERCATIVLCTYCGLLCTLAPSKILLGLHVVMVLSLYKLHGLTVSACVSKQQRNRDQEVVIVVIRLLRF